jgi:hypothetical protein
MKMVRGTLILLAAAVCSMGVAYAFGGNHLTIHNEMGGAHFCMDASLDHGVNDGDPVYVFHCHGRENQRWTVTQSTDGQPAIIGVEGYCLDVRGFGRGPGTPIQLYKCHFLANQRFSLLPDGHIREVQSQKCLSALAPADRAPVVLDFCQPVPNQIWYEQP